MTIYVCSAGCRHPSGSLVSHGRDTLAELLPPRSNFGYDVMVFVGRARFFGHRQRDEIRAALLEEYGLSISTGEISRLAERFVHYVARLHHASAGALCAVLRDDGGWPLHIDATGEDGRGTFLVARAGWRPWVLGAWKIPTENTDAILACLRSLAATFGSPVAIMRDLGRAMRRAVDDFVAELPEGTVRVLSCHMHFLRAVGTGLLDAPHSALRGLFRRLKIRPDLAALARALGRDLDTRIREARVELAHWQEDTRSGHAWPAGDAGLAAVRSVTQWVLDFTAGGNDEGFPFDRPYLDLYRRCKAARRALEAFALHPPQDLGVERAATKLARILERVTSDVPGAILASKLEAAAALFDELRTALRLFPKPGGRNDPPPAAAVSGAERLAELRDLRQNVERLEASLRQRRAEPALPDHMRPAIDRVLRQLDRYGPTLWGHAIPLPAAASGGRRVVDRTNNQQEHAFHTWKRGERRRSGRKILTQDFEALPAATPLVFNLLDPQYVATVCGSFDELPAAFAKLDAAQSQGLPASVAASFALDPLLTETASLPRADRTLVRRPGMRRLILEAANTSAPHSRSRRPRPTG